MKQMWHKTISYILSMILLMAMFAVPMDLVFAEEEYYFSDNFEGQTTLENWEAGNGGNAGGKYGIGLFDANEGKVLRLNPWGDSGITGANRPSAVLKANVLNIPLQNRGNRKIFIKTSLSVVFDTNRNTKHAMRLANTENDDTYKLFDFRETKGTHYFSYFDASGTIKQHEEFHPESNVWYDVEVVINPDNSVNYTVKEGSEIKVSVVGGLQSDIITDLSAITNPCFDVTNPSTATRTAMYIDNVVVCINEPEAKLLTNEYGKIPANGKIGIHFTRPMDETTLNDETVVLMYGEETITCDNRSYNKDEQTYYIQPNDMLLAGETYKVVLGDDIFADYPKEDTVLYESGRLVGTKSFDFVAERVKSQNASLAWIKVNGKIIEDFDADTLSYNVDLQYEENLSAPEITFEREDLLASADVTATPDGIEGITEITVVAEDGITVKKYSVNVTIVGEELARLGENLLVNGDFESGEIAPWVPYSEGVEWNGFTVTNEEAHEGEYAARLSDIKGQTWRYMQKVNVEADKTYLLAGWVKVADSANNNTAYLIYAEGNVESIDNEKTYATADKWQLAIRAVQTSKGATALSPGIVSWLTNIDYYVDDLYLGELKPIIKNNIESQVDIPSSGSLNIELESDVVNQFGTKNGLQNTVLKEWRLIDAPYGVSLSDSLLEISSDADAGVVEVESVYTTGYLGSYADEITLRSTIELTDNSSPLPKAKNITLSGKVAPGEILHASYHYYHKEGALEGNSEIKWLWSTEENGEYKPILDEEGNPVVGENCEVSAPYDKYYIRVNVLPKTIDNVEGTESKSAGYLYRDCPPIAKNVRINAPEELGVGDVLEGEYDFWDINGDKEGTTTFRWLRADKETGEFLPIGNATADTYKLTEDDIDKYLKFEVTPVSVNTPEKEEAFKNEKALRGPSAPVATKVSIKSLGGGLYAGSYTYSHPNNVVEGKSILKWYSDNKFVGEGSTYINNTAGKVDIRFEVTPIAQKAPFSGKTVSSSITVGGSSSGSGSGGFGGGGHNGSIVPVPDVPATPETPVLKPENKPHWAQNEINWALENDIMKNKTQTDFEPEALTTREEFVSCMLKVIGMQPKAYQGGFDDISTDNGFSGYLQAAVDGGIISADKSFYPQRAITREELCKIVAEGLRCVQIQTETADNLKSYEDSSIISQWATPYVSRMVAAGLLKGVSDTQFLPKGNVTRAQAAVVLKRIVSFIDASKAGGAK